MLPGGPAFAEEGGCRGLATTITGSDEADVLVGTPGDDVIDARGGRDSVDGRGGADVICGGKAADKIRGGPGDDEIFGGPGQDRGYGEGGADLLVEDQPINTYQFKHVDRLFGGKGPDRLRMETPARGSLDGGTGNDSLVGLTEGATLIGSWGNDRLQGQRQQSDGGPSCFLTGRLNYRRAPGPVVIDLVQGTATGWGRDTIVDAGSHVYGSRFDDEISVTDCKSALWAESGSDTLVAPAGSGVTAFGGDGPDEINTAGKFNTVYGGAGADRITDAEGASTLEGGPGNDQIFGGDGADDLRGDGVGVLATGAEDMTGNDEVFGESGKDSLSGGRGDDVLDGGPGDDGIEFGSAAHHESAFGDDTLLGGAGDDVLQDGSTGREDIRGGEGADRVVIDPAVDDETEDLIDGGPGTGDVFDFQNFGPLTINLAAGTAEGRGSETISGFENVWASLYNDGDDQITGNDEDNIILARGGDDVIRGLGGNDTIEAGAGTDDVDGGPGSDVCSGAESTFGCES
jgi:Ca2+-binding RTX toxin-like protein